MNSRHFGFGEGSCFRCCYEVLAKILKIVLSKKTEKKGAHESSLDATFVLLFDDFNLTSDIHADR